MFTGIYKFHNNGNNNDDINYYYYYYYYYYYNRFTTLYPGLAGKSVPEG